MSKSSFNNFILLFFICVLILTSIIILVNSLYFIWKYDIFPLKKHIKRVSKESFKKQNVTFYIPIFNMLSTSVIAVSLLFMVNEGSNPCEQDLNDIISLNDSDDITNQTSYMSLF